MSSTQIPTPEAVGPPSLMERPIAQVTEKQLMKAAKLAGMSTLKPSTIRAFKRIGQFLNDEGIALIQAGRIVHCSEQLRELAQTAKEVVDTVVDPQVKIDAVKAAVLAYKEAVEADQTVVRMLEQKMIGVEQPARKHRAFAPGTVVAISTPGPVNVTNPE